MALLTQDQIGREAIKLRERMGIHHQPFPCVVTCIFKAKRIGLIKNYQCVSKREMKEEGAFDPDTGILYIRDDVFQAANLGAPSTRFAVAHEFGHAALGHTRKRFRAATTADRVDVPKVIQGEERQANLFAATFLAPSCLAPLDFEPTALTISSHFGISLTAAEYLLPEMERAYRIKHGIKRPLPKEVTDFLASFKPKIR